MSLSPTSFARPDLVRLARAWLPAAVVFKPGERATYKAPGEEEMSGNAQELFSKAQEAEKKGNIKGAIKAYRTLVRKHPRDTLAPGSLYRMAQLQEQTRQYLKAAQSYAILAEKFPKSDRFDESIEALFRIGEMYLAGRKVKISRHSLQGVDGGGRENFYASIIRTAPYGKYTARAHFDTGRAREKQGANEAALAAYQQVVEKFPNDPLAVDAQYQIGYIWTQGDEIGHVRSERRGEGEDRLSGFSLSLSPKRKIGAGPGELEDAGQQADQHCLRDREVLRQTKTLSGGRHLL